jgi:SHS2 domain-containing protein
MYRFLKHTADLKVRIRESSLEMAFITSALALKQAIAEGIMVKPKKTRKIKVSGDDLSSLLYNFLEEFLFLLDSKGFLLAEIDNLKLDKKKFEIIASISGDLSKNYKFSNDVKAITYNEMKIKQEKKQTIIEFVLDV